MESRPKTMVMPFKWGWTSRCVSLVKIVAASYIVLVFFCSHFYLWFYFHNFFVVEHFEVLDIVFFAKILMNTFNLDYLLLNRQRVLSLWNRIYDFTHGLKKLDPAVLRLCKTYLAISALVTAFTITWDALVKCTLAPMNVAFDYTYLIPFCFGCNITTKSMRELRYMKCSEGLMYGLGEVTMSFGTPAFAGCLFLLLGELFRQTNDDIKSALTRRANWYCCDIVALRERYEVLQRLVAEADRLISVTQLFWFLTSVIANCNGISKLCRYMDFYVSVPPEFVLQSLINFIPLFYSAFISFFAARIPRGTQDGFLLVRALRVSCKCLGHSAHGEQFLLMSQLSFPPTGMTIGGMFVISKNTFISQVGCVLTYVVILLQLYPNIMQKFRDT